MEEMKKNSSQTGLEIAVIGMAGRFPGAKDIHAFWENLKNGVESVTLFSDEELIEAGIDPEIVRQPNYVKVKGYVEDIQYFDSSFFNYTPNEAEIMDPQVRIFHECAWHALEDAGYDPQSYNGLIGLYAGYNPNIIWKLFNLYHLKSGSEFLEVDNLNSNHFTSIICYKLNLKGPGVSINTTCSTSLVAIHMACRALLTGEADMVLTGGVAITLPSKTGYVYEEGMVMSPDGHCRAFDAKANGTSSGNGVGIVVLKRLARALKDGDHIYAVIKGTAINNDGNRKLGYTAPSVEAQSEVIRAAQRMAEVEPESITYIETHGTGTPLGDSIEIEALKKAFKTTMGQSTHPTKVSSYKKNSCALGFVKANIGHLDAAAGVAGFIKTVLALNHRLIPPSVNFDSPNPKIDFENSPFYVNRELKGWKGNGYPLRAGVSSFGIGGTNAHVVLEEWSEDHPGEPGSRPYQLVLLSAKTETALDRMTKNLADYLKENPELLADAAYTLQVGRRAFSHRRMLVCPNQHEAIPLHALLSANSGKVRNYITEVENRPVVFMFPGLGTQYLNMGLDLYRTEPLFQETMNQCFTILSPMVDSNIEEILYPSFDSSASSAVKINQFEIAQLVVFIFEYALAQLMMKLGIKPHSMIGYSFGEYVAACISNVFSLEDVLTLIVGRGRLIRKIPAGAMLSVPMTKGAVKPLLTDRLSIAIDNGDSCVVAGPKDDIDAFETQMKGKRYICIRLEASHGLHSMMMDPILKEFEEQVGQLTLNKPQIPFISNVTGKWITVEDAVSPRYWVTHLRQTVQFSQGLKELMGTKNAVFLEVGPGVTLSTLAYPYITKESNQPVVNLVRSPDQKISDMEYLLGKIGRLWLYGTKIEWTGFYAKKKRKRIPLPSYPFEKLNYRADIPKQELMLMVQKGEIKMEKQAPLPSAPTYTRSEKKTPYVPPGNRAEQILVQMWEELLGVKPIGIHDNLLDMGVTSLKGLTFVNRFKEQLGVGEIIHITTVFDAPTVSELTAYFKSNYPQSFARLIEAQPGEEQAPSLPETKPAHPVPENLLMLNKASVSEAVENIFFVHEASGEVGIYIELSRQLGKLAPRFNCWGIKADRLKNYTPQNWRVEEIAARYVQKIKELQPRGPYYLVSWSGGGNLVFEIALQLEQIGENLALLAFIECIGPMGLSNNDAQEFTLETEKSMVIDINEHLSDNDIDKGLEKITNIDQVWPYVVDYVKSSEVHTEELKFLALEDELLAMLNFDGGLRVEEIVQYFNRSRTYVNAFSQYIPGRKIQTPIHYISGSQSQELQEHWNDYCYTPMIYHTINGDHYSMFRHPQVKEFARLFMGLLENKNQKKPQRKRVKMEKQV
jgi:acyl transferase domain-containing protein